MEDTRPKFLESVTEHPDVQRLIKQVVRSDLRIKELQAENERLKEDINKTYLRLKKEMDEQIDGAKILVEHFQYENERLKEALRIAKEA